MALGASRARPSWWRLPTGARRMLRIFSQFSLPPGRATNSRLFPFPHHCRLRFRHLSPRREVTTSEHLSDERSASLDSPFSLLWNSCSRSPEYARCRAREPSRGSRRQKGALCARQMGLSVVGTVGLLLRAKREHMVPEVTDKKKRRFSEWNKR